MKNSGRGGDNPDPDPEKVHVNHGTEVFKGSETTNEEHICPKHKIEMQVVDSGTSDPETNEPITYYNCYECEYEEKDSATIPMEKDFIAKYSKFLMKSKSVPEFVAQASCEFLISIGLYHAIYTNTKGRVLSNEAYRHIADSGHNKSPLYKFMADEVIPKAFSDYNYYMTGRGTSRGITTMVQKEKDGRMIPIIFMRDEDSVLYKADSYNKDMFEGYSDLFDGNIPSNTTNVNGHQAHKKCVASYWSTGTPISIKYIDVDFFAQGWAWRHFILMDDSLIPESPLSDDDLTAMEDMTNSMIEELKQMAKIKTIKSTPEFMKALNGYYSSVIKEKNEIEKKKGINVLSLEWVQTESKTKAPEHLIKLAMIHSASRWNVKDDMLIMDLEDFNYAKEKFELYRSQMIKFFNVWVEKREPVDFTEKSNRIMEIIRAETERYSVEKIIKNIKNEKTGITETVFSHIANKDPNGDWVKRSNILHLSHLPVGGWNGFDAVIETLEKSEMIESTEASIDSKFKNKNGKEISFKKPIGLIKLL